MQKLQNEQILRKLFFIFLIIQPILDCYLLYTDEVIAFFNFSPTTIIRMLIIAFLFCFLFFNRKNLKNLKIIVIYGGILLAYILAHHFVVYTIDNSEYSTFSYSVITELFYIIRMLLPIAVIFITYKLKPTKEEFIQLFFIVTAIVSIIIVGSNLIVMSRASYGNGFIKGNIFDWFFNNKYLPQELASKGWFNSANQISGLMYILLPLCIYALFEKVTKTRIVVILLAILSMIMLGTRVASYGWFLIVVMMIILYLFFAFVIKNIQFNLKTFIVSLLILLFGIGIMTHAPIVNTGSSVSSGNEEQLKSLKSEKVSNKKMLEYIGMNEVYYNEIYPYEEHKKFWAYVINDVPADQRVGNRNSQQLITDDVADTYKSISTSLFGLGYSRFINAKLYLEKDFVIQYHTMGIFGILLFLLPYLGIAIYSFIINIKKRKISLFNITALSILLLPLCISYFSGHIVDELIITLYLGFIAGYILYDCRKEQENAQS